MLKRTLSISLLVLALWAPPALAGTRVEVDRSFGSHGTVRAASGPSYGWTAFTAVEPQPDGSLLATRTGPETLIRRYTAAGALDTSFAPVAPSVEPADVDAEGKTVRLFPATPEGSLERLNPDGTPDPTFGTHPYEERKLSEAAGFRIEMIETLPSGRILVAGSAIIPGSPTAEGAWRFHVEQVALARFEHDGHLDQSFGNGGIVKLKADLGIEGVRLTQLTPRPDGGAAVAMLDTAPSEFSEAEAHAGSTIAVLTADGHSDASYGPGGAIRVPDAAIFSIHLLPGGKLLAAGDRWGPEFFPGLHESAVVLARYSAGAPDPGFGGGDGTVALDLGGLDLFGSALWADDGSAWLGGSATAVEKRNCRLYRQYCTETPFVARVTPAGTLDAGFGSGGIVRLARLSYGFGEKEGGEGVRALALRAGGGVFAAGGAGTAAFIAALAPDGAPDPGFGDGGFLTEKEPHRGEASARSLTVDGRGRILVAGEATTGILDSWGASALFRYLPSGKIDRGFAGGYVRVSGRGSEVVVGEDDVYFALSGRSGDAVTKVRANGKIDRSFGDEGTAYVGLGPEVHRRGRHYRIQLLTRSMVALPGGRLLLAGRAGLGDALTFLLRLRADGTPDPTFGGDGFALIGFGGHRACAIHQIAAQRDGRILVAGYVDRPGAEVEEEALSVLRLRPDGSRDRSFGHRGLTLLPIARRSFANALAVEGSGRILVAGKGLGRANRARELLLRLDARGHLDRSFGRRGMSSRRVPFRPGGFWAAPRQLLLQRHRILVLRDSEERQLLVYSHDGRRRHAFRVARGAEPENRAIRAPLGVLQDRKLLLGWTVYRHHRSSFKLQRLRVQGRP